MNNVDLLTSREVAQELGRDIRTVHRMVQRGDLRPVMQVPGYRGALLFNPADVEALVSREVSA